MAMFAAWTLTTATGAHASPTAFHDRTAFDVATAGLSQADEGFDGNGAGDLIASGESLGPYRFDCDFSGVALAVTDGAAFGSGGFDTTSPSNLLGTDSDDSLFDGDVLTIGFADPVHAVGLYLISGDTLEDGDATLSVGTLDVLLDIDNLQGSLGDGAEYFFLGAVDTSQGFSSVVLSTDGVDGFFFTLDDFVSASASTSPVPRSTTS